MTEQDERILLSTMKQLRNSNTSFSVQTLQNEAGLKLVSPRTVNNYLNKHKYRYLQSRKKGFLTAKDKKNRIKFARKVIRLLPENFWRDGIQFYFDGVSFAHKTNRRFCHKDHDLVKTKQRVTMHNKRKIRRKWWPHGTFFLLLLPITKALFYVKNIMKH